MKTLAKSLLARALVLLLLLPAAHAQPRTAFDQRELDQMLAPVALYPDALLSQVLMAATYPVEVAQAARWSRANPGYTGQDAVNAVEGMDWDPSVKSLVAFPPLLARMDERIDWTQQLGEAFLAQPEQVMDTVQALRTRALEAGHLGSDEFLRVTRDASHIVIEPARPEVVYVPYYDPRIVYGPWWWAAYPPVYWGPPAGYYPHVAYPYGWLWGSGVRISLGFFFGAFDWHRRHVHVVRVHHYHRDAGRAYIAPGPEPVRWRHDIRHRRGAPYRHTAAPREFTRFDVPARAPHSAVQPREASPARAAADDTRRRMREETRDGRPGGPGLYRRNDDTRDDARPATNRRNEHRAAAGSRPPRSESPAPRFEERRRESGSDAGGREYRRAEPRPQATAPRTVNPASRAETRTPPPAPPRVRNDDRGGQPAARNAGPRAPAAEPEARPRGGGRERGGENRGRAARHTPDGRS